MTSDKLLLSTQIRPPRVISRNKSREECPLGTRLLRLLYQGVKGAGIKPSALKSGIKSLAIKLWHERPFCAQMNSQAWNHGKRRLQC